MKITRFIAAYNKKSGELFKEFRIDNFSTSELRKILGKSIYGSDFKILGIYAISKEQLQILSKRIPELLKMKEDNLDFFIECFSGEIK